jgi:uncharacterized CHY-type Zn-finger protein
MRDKGGTEGVSSLNFTVQFFIMIKGKIIDTHSRCQHYHSALDIIAIKFKCCGDYYPCFLCHEETAGHQAEVWGKAETDTLAILCGVCRHEMTIAEYQNSGSLCPNCGAAFNPRCALHYHLYFEI